MDEDDKRQMKAVGQPTRLRKRCDSLCDLLQVNVWGKGGMVGDGRCRQSETKTKSLETREQREFFVHGSFVRPAPEQNAQKSVWARRPEGF